MSHHKNIEGFFHKSFEFVGNQNWLLPTEAYKTAPWQINTLLKMKIELNNVKNQLSSFDLERWSAHTKFRDPSSHIVSVLKARASIELLTQAWCKFYECLNRYPVVPEIAVYKQELTSLHLCEAPGAFISALNRFLYTHHRKINWNWTATTLNPYYEGNPASDMIADDRLIRHTLAHWNFGADLTGDLMKYYNHQVLVEDRFVMLVTADGSVDCMKDPGEQENNVHYLHYCETMTALKVLEKWGNFILKIFTIFEHGTICLLYLLNCCFVNVNIFKPCSSKSGNSEVYVICTGYKGWEVLEMLWPSLIGPYQGFIKTEDTAMFPLESISSEFLQQIEDCSNFFKQLQCHTINENVRHFIGQENDDEEINSIKTDVAERFIKKYRLAFHIPKRHKLITNYEKHKTPIIEEAWDFKLVNVIELPFPNENNVIKAKIGCALVTVTNSKFCNVNFNLCKLNSTNDNKLLEEVLPLLSPHYRTIQKTLCENKPQYVYQRTLFYNFMDNLESNADVVLIRIPLLTRFLVGLIYIVAQGFTTIAMFRKGALILQNPVKERVHIVQTFLKAIESVYRHIDNETNFTADILEITSSKLFENGSFDKLICTYNNELFSE